MGVIFISYRRSDSEYAAGRIYDALATHYGSERIFKDVDRVVPGSRWEDAIDQAMSATTVLLVVIGPNWVSAADAATSQRRLDDPQDELRREVSKGLANYPATTVIPVLISGATMPSPEQLPENLRELTRRQAVSVRGEEHFHSDIGSLIAAIDSAGLTGRHRRSRSSEASRRRGRVWIPLSIILLIAGGIAIVASGVFESDEDGAPADNANPSELGPSESVVDTSTTPLPPAAPDIAGTYYLDPDSTRVIVVEPLGGATYNVYEREPASWPFTGQVSYTGDQTFRGTADFTTSAATMEIVMVLSPDGNLVTEFRFITESDGVSTDRVDKHLLVPT